MFKKLITMVILPLLIPLFSMGQYQLSGKITDKETNEALACAHIIVENSFIKTTSAKNGEFLLKNLKGKLKIKVSYIGFKNQIQEIEITKNTVLNFELERSTILEDEVIITATRAGEKTPTAFTNISKKEIQDINLGQDIPMLLDATPSVITTSDAGAGIGYTGIRIRGTDMTRINITVNGIPINDAESHGVFWVNMPDFASSVDDIQIQRGVGTSTNGAAAFGASINMQTLKLNAKPYTEISNSYGSFNTLKHTVSVGTGLLDGKWSIDGRLSKLSTDGYIDRAFSDLKSFYISGAYYGKKSMLKLNIFSGKEHTYQAWNGVPKDSLKTNRTYNSYTYENETDNYQQDHYQLHYSYQLNRFINFNSALHLTKGLGYYEQFKDGRSFADYKLNDVIIGGDTITETDLIQQKWLDNNFYGITYSVNYNKNKVRASLGGAWNKYDGEHFGKIIWAQNANNSEINHQWYFNNGLKTDFNVFAKVNYQIIEKLSLYGDLQFRQIDYNIKGDHDDLRDLTQNHTYSFINPKVGAFYELNEKHQSYFSFAIGNREPSRNSFKDADPNKMPTAETLYDYELGYNFNLPKFILNCNIYYMDYKDQLVLTGKINSVGDPIMTNVTESFRSGIEISTAWQITDKLRWNINATYSENKIKQFTEFVDNWDTWGQDSMELGKTDIAFSPKIIANSQLTYELIENFNISFVTKYVDEQFIDNTSSSDRKLDSYIVNNLRFNYSFKTKLFKEVGLNLMLNNIFNEEYESNAWVYRYTTGGQEYAMDGYFPQAGINFLFALNLKL
ncbi:MAG: TonB-dependent receptor [Saprospiraceae bacterium]|nr:TonB-dependent receptor [Saprospiraceae bacterium]